jgi:glycosyltransferase involved in cell wall biosynthesis
MKANRNGPALLDARWLGIGGPGRVAEHLLRGFHEIQPPGKWVVWGPDAVDAHLWPDATRVPNRHHPKALYSQREFPGPRSWRPRVAYYTHHLRPAWRLAPVELTTVHDTIPFRYPPSRALAPLMRAYIRWMARHSTLVTTDSEFSKQSLQEDLGLSPERIVVLKLAIDHESAARIKQLRTTATPVERVIFVGRDAPHKNLDRLVRGFAPTEFAAQGAVLTLAGVDGSATERLRSLASQLGAKIELPGVVPQAELEDLLASATLLIQPSLEEGFGLPVAEALAAGIPVAVSTGGSLPEIVRGTRVEMFDPHAVDEISQAIDRVAASPLAPPSPVWPRPRDYAASVLAAIDQAESLR